MQYEIWGSVPPTKLRTTAIEGGPLPDAGHTWRATSECHSTSQYQHGSLSTLASGRVTLDNIADHTLDSPTVDSKGSLHINRTRKQVSK